ncbi:MAG: hypothetical protein HY335_03150 [Deinococcus sp.]|nr:hypothetical protein [Deinococcus sp.]
MKRASWGILALLVGAAALVLPALADGGPHGNFTATTDACAGCHRPHQARAANLLTVSGSSRDLCLSCHGSAGLGADTNVEDGVFMERDGITESPAQGRLNAPLRGGGFVNALMDTDFNGTLESQPVTSTHTIDSSPGIAWGGGSEGFGTPVTLECTNCHDPHGNGTFRMLRPIPLESDQEAGVTLADEDPKVYTIAQDQYWNEFYRSGLELSRWCATCHDRYFGSSRRNPQPDQHYMYIHTTNNTFVNCLSCHVAHGTSARMTTDQTQFSASVPWPDGSTTPNGDARSSLLRLDNRGVCQQCHFGNRTSGAR